MESVIATVTGYHGLQKFNLTKLIYHAGGNYVGYMNPSVTHLVLSPPHSDPIRFDYLYCNCDAIADAELLLFFSIVFIRFAGSLKARSTSLRENLKFLLLIIDGLKIVLRNADVFRSILMLLVGMQLFFLT